MEGLLNYFYYFGAALNQYDEVGHILHFSLYDVRRGRLRPVRNCRQNWPAIGGGRTTGSSPRRIRASACSARTSRGSRRASTSSRTAGLRHRPLPGSVCPDGSTDHAVCNPAEPEPEFPDIRARPHARPGPGRLRSRRRALDPGRPGLAPAYPAAARPAAGPRSDIQDQLDDILDLPGKALDDLGLGGKKGKGGGGKNLGDALNDVGSGGGKAAQDLLDFLLGP